MTSKTTTLLATVTILLSIYVLGIDRRNHGGVSRDFSALPMAQAEEIGALSISGAGGTIDLERTEGGGWKMVAPVADRANAKKVDELITTLLELKKLETLDEDTPPEASLGFDGDSLTVAVKSPDGDDLGTLTFGDYAGVEGAIYARWEKDSPFVCWQDARDLAAVPHDALRDPNLLGLGVEQMRRLKIKRDSQTSLVVDQEVLDGPWLINKPLKTLADPKAVNQRLSVIANINADGFIDNPNGDIAAAFAAGSKSVSVWRHRARGPVEILMAKSADGETGFAQVSDREGTFRIDPAAIDALRLDPNDLRDRRLLPFNPKSAMQVEIDAKPDLHVSLLLDESGWQLVEGGKKYRANRQRVAAVLKALATEEVQSFVADAAGDLRPYGLDNPTLTITIGTIARDPENPETDAGAPNLIHVPHVIQVKRQLRDDQPVPIIYATVKGSGTVVRLSEAFASIIPVRPLDYRSLYLWPTFNLASLSALSSTRPPSPALEMEYLFDTNEWTGTRGGEDITARIDRGQALGLAQQLSLPLRAKRWLSGDTTNAIKALEKPILQLGFVLKDEQGKDYPFGLDIAPINPDLPSTLFYTRAHGEESICLIDRKTFDILNLPLLAAPQETEE